MRADWPKKLNITIEESHENLPVVHPHDENNQEFYEKVIHQ